MNVYQVVLTQQIKTERPAPTASDAVKDAMQDVAEAKTAFVPSKWSVKEIVKEEPVEE